MRVCWLELENQTCWVQARNDPHQGLANSGPWDKSVLVNALSLEHD